jgi:tetratricopeptide (TPR) repeat protein
MKATTLLGMGKYDDALNAYREANRKDPNESAAYVGISKILCDHKKQYNEALKTVDSGLERDPLDLQLLYNRCVILHCPRRYEEVLKTSSRILKIEPTHIGGLHWRAYALYRLKEYGEALDAFNKALEVHPSSLDLLYGRIEVFLKLEMVEKAFADYERAIELGKSGGIFQLASNFQLSDIQQNYAYRLWERQKLEEALTVIEQALELAPKNPDLLAQRASISASLGQHAAAQADIEKVRHSERRSAYALIECIGILTQYLRDYEKALDVAEEYYQAIDAPSLNDEISLAYYRVYCFRGLGREEEAKEAAARLVIKARSDPDNKPRCYMAYLFAIAGDRQKAEAILNSLEEPNDAMGLDNFSRAYAVLGNEERALHLLDRAVELGMQWYPPPVDLGPDFEHLKDDPRYQAIIAKIHGE